MKNIWKWILGIVLVLVLIAVVGFTWQYFAVHSRGVAIMDGYGRGEWRMPMQDGRGFAPRFHAPMMGGRGFFPYGGFFFLGGLLRLIIPIGVLALVIYLAYRAGKNAGMGVAQRSELPAALTSESPAEDGE